jgi:hypothetical protein
MFGLIKVFLWVKMLPEVTPHAWKALLAKALKESGNG